MRPRGRAGSIRAAGHVVATYSPAGEMEMEVAGRVRLYQPIRRAEGTSTMRIEQSRETERSHLSARNGRNGRNVRNGRNERNVRSACNVGGVRSRVSWRALM